MYKLALLTVLCSFVVCLPTEREKQRQAILPSVRTNCLDTFKNVPSPCRNNPSRQVYFPHPKDESKFLQCDIHNRMYIVQCPENYLFSTAISSCRASQPSAATDTPTITHHICVNINNGVTRAVEIPYPACPVCPISPRTSYNYASKNVPNPCKDNPDSQLYFPHPTDTSKFIQCDRYGRMYIIQCPGNLLYSTSTSSCHTVKPVTNPPVVIVTNPPKTTEPPVIINPNNPCTPQTLAAGQIYFPVQGDITKFIQCDHLGHASILPCVSGLLWSQAQLACIYPINVKTGTRPGIGDMVNPCSRENILNNKLFFSHPDNSMFIQCDLWGDAYVVSCPVGRIWNQYLETCTAAHT